MEASSNCSIRCWHLEGKSSWNRSHCDLPYLSGSLLQIANGRVEEHWGFRRTHSSIHHIRVPRVVNGLFADVLMKDFEAEKHLTESGQDVSMSDMQISM
jgi:hypothetical protein